MFCYLFDAWERFIAFAESFREWDAWHIHELLIVALLLPIAIAVFTRRRLLETREWLREREALVESLRAHRADATAGRSEIERLSQTDHLTGLASRRRLLDELERLIRERPDESRVNAILYVDCDHFRRINDSLGHEQGDAVLQALATHFQQCLQDEAHLLARFGSDEFVVLLRNLAKGDDATSIAQRLVASLSSPLHCAGATLSISVSVGVVILDAQCCSAVEALQDADSAMYEAKRLGRDRFVLFSSSLRNHLLRHVRLESALRAAVFRKELYLVYQPIVSLATGEINGVEALARWNHPEFGAISPGEFIPIAEESELILEIGEWVLCEACRQMATWLNVYPTSAPEVMSLNLSRKQFAQPELTRMVAETVRRFNVPPQRIQLEITEDAYAGDFQEAIRVMTDLKKAGVRLAMDDFGVGTSSFSALRQFPIDVLKIDRSLVTDTPELTESAAIMHSLALMARNMGAKLVAEGVENAEQVLALQDLGCKYAQGYFFGKPMTAELIEARFSQNQGFEMCTAGANAFGNSWQQRLPAFQRLEIEEVAVAKV